MFARMLALDQLESSFFEPLLGERFRLVAEEGTLDLKLVEVSANERLRRDNRRAPFALLFHATGSEPVPQRIYRIEHAGFGAMEIFLVPVKRDDTGFYLEAIFN
jgi:hypothetical protein